MAYANLLFAVASFTGATADVPPPPPPPPVVVKVETVTVTQQLDSPTIVVEDVETVTFDTGDGVATTDRATFDKLVETAALGETAAEYHARLCFELQEVKPWIDWGCAPVNVQS